MIVIKDLRIEYGELVAVDGLSLRVPQGSLFGLLGPNGAGKSSTLGCIAGLIAPKTGTVMVGGHDVGAEPGAVRSLLGLAPQALSLYSALSVRDNLRFLGGLAGLTGRQLMSRVDWAMELSQLRERARAPVETLSGGMKRRLNLAASLLNDPQVLLCDEPTTGVDPQSRNHLFETIRALNDEGRTIVYTTHYMEEVEALCQEVAIMDEGRLVVQDKLSDLLRTTGNTRYALELGEAFDSATLTARLQQAGIPVAGLAAGTRTLEDVFLELTGRALRDAS